MERYDLENILNFISRNSNLNQNQNNVYNINYINNIEINSTNREIPVNNQEIPVNNQEIPVNNQEIPVNNQEIRVGRRIEPIIANINLENLGRNSINELTTRIEQYLNNIYTEFNIEESDETNNPIPLNILNRISSLIIVKESTEETYLENSCSICNEQLEINDIIRKINSCNHYFHQKCIDTWFSDNSTCPICRINLITNSYESEE